MKVKKYASPAITFETDILFETGVSGGPGTYILMDPTKDDSVVNNNGIYTINDPTHDDYWTNQPRSH